MKYSLYPVMILREIRLRVRVCSTMSEIKSVHRKEGDVCHKMEEDSIPSINGWTQPPLVWRLNGIGGGVSIRQALVKKHWLLERLQPCKHVFRYNVYHRIVSLACWYANNPSRGAGISVCTKCHHLLAVELFHKKNKYVNLMAVPGEHTGITKVKWFIIRGPWMSIHDWLTIHPIAIEIFYTKVVDRATLLSFL